MIDFIKRLFSSDFMPHNHCFLQKGEVIWLHVLSDAAIALAYFSIPTMLIFFVRKRKDIPFRIVFWLFGTFIVACGMTHVMAIWTMWDPVYRLDGAIKALTAFASIGTAVALIRIIPAALSVPSPLQLERLNQELATHIVERKRAEEALLLSHQELESRVKRRTEALSRSNDALHEEIRERELAEQALRESEERFRATFEQAAVGIAHVTPEGRWLRVNNKLCEIVGYSREELLGMTFQDITHPDDLGGDLEHLNRMLRREIDTYNIEKRYLRKGGATVWIALTVSIVVDEGGRPKYFISVVEDITARHAAAEKLRNSLTEKEVLLKEIHHRVKNNMQIVSSLLQLQSNQVSDPEMADMFVESQGRIRTMALIHEKLYRARDLAQIDFKEYVESLTSLLTHTYASGAGNVTVELDLESVQLGLDTAVPVGLILNEFVTNSIKHAFPDGRAGVISISLKRRSANSVEINVHDNGVGVPAGFDLSSNETLGLRLVKILVAQIEGELNHSTGMGMHYTLSFNHP